ncbi:9743_t:CDS:2 [Ambispora gerdemannii]|uniref:9743_t:CDS:1 n=1 Tax=Ambispora gerdemannii TaxID=144530 RepID=A0A9N9D8N4_9GLOM|nr:9743_t:CDS:2 [Ambispora gerdemannii]
MSSIPHSYKFCPKCDCVLRPKVSTETYQGRSDRHFRKLKMRCSVCDYSQDADIGDHRVSRTEFKPWGCHLQEIPSPDLKFDATIHRREKQGCPECKCIIEPLELHTRHQDSLRCDLMCSVCEAVFPIPDDPVKSHD